MKDLLLEIGCEEIPARYVDEILSGLKQTAQTIFADKKIGYKQLSVFSTPRRLVLKIKDLNEEQESISYELKGPAKNFAFNDNNKPTKALLGFVNGKGKTVEDVFFKQVNGVDYCFLKINSTSLKTEDLLPQILTDIITSMPLPRSMKWNVFDFKFIRPIRWILALFGSNKIKLKIEDIESSNYTFGHRTLANVSVEVSNTDVYDEILKSLFVVLNEEDRKQMILNQIKQIESKNSVKVFVDKSLLKEVVNLVEYPTADLGSFDKKYLKLPDEVLITPMKDHQRYFPVFKNEKLANMFVYVRNGDEKNIEIVRKGNEKVLVARLADAEFFFDEDLKHSLNDLAKKLNQIVFRDGLGTMADKSMRIENIAKILAKQIGFNEIQSLETASRLCKADLLTNMVNEFEELQGVMGKVYGKLEGLNDTITRAIGSHYLPRNAEDEVPADELGAILSVSDKLDSIMSSFAINVTPTGSQDPFGLRRQCLGIINVVLSKNWKIDLKNLFESVAPNYKEFKTTDSILVKMVTEFFIERLKAMNENVSYDILDAVLNGKTVLEIVNLQEKIKSVLIFAKNPDFSKLQESLGRIKKLVAKNKTESKIEENLFVTSYEENLFKTIKQIEDIKYDDFLSEMNSYLKLISPITELFDNVLIMDKDEKVKNNRLSLLAKCLNYTNKIADLTLLKI